MGTGVVPALPGSEERGVGVILLIGGGVERLLRRKTRRKISKRLRSSVLSGRGLVKFWERRKRKRKIALVGLGLTLDVV